MAGYLFAADRVATQYANRALGYVDDDVIRELDSKNPENITSTDRFLRTLNNHRWQIIGGSWAVSMVGALAYTFSNRYLTTQQKLVQARMYAQAVTIAVLMASATVSIYVGEDKNKKVDEPDDELRAVLNLPVQQSRSVRMPQAASPNEDA
ncbi:hypothetical protein BJV82DRAFT_508549 [Fennellomyces sp. T-0311]|nr:hypothetical protein BJV82DRAFT_508549 [Fennellomyces sp. T-0311]